MAEFRMKKSSAIAMAQAYAASTDDPAAAAEAGALEIFLNAPAQSATTNAESGGGGDEEIIIITHPH